MSKIFVLVIISGPQMESDPAVQTVRLDSVDLAASNTNGGSKIGGDLLTSIIFWRTPPF